MIRLIKDLITAIIRYIAGYFKSLKYRNQVKQFNNLYLYLKEREK